MKGTKKLENILDLSNNQTNIVNKQKLVKNNPSWLAANQWTI